MLTLRWPFRSTFATHGVPISTSPASTRAHPAPQATPAGATPSRPARTPRTRLATPSARPSATRRGSSSQTATPRLGTSPTPHARQTPASACTARNTATRPSPARKPRAPRPTPRRRPQGAESPQGCLTAAAHRARSGCRSTPHAARSHTAPPRPRQPRIASAQGPPRRNVLEQDARLKRDVLIQAALGKGTPCIERKLPQQK